MAEYHDRIRVGAKKAVGQGGGSKDYFWNQLKADILNLTYQILEGTSLHCWVMLFLEPMVSVILTTFRGQSVIG